MELFAKALPASPRRSPASRLFLLLLPERIYSVEIYYIDRSIFLLLNFLSTFILPQRVQISIGDNSSPSSLLNYLPEPGPWASISLCVNVVGCHPAPCLGRQAAEVRAGQCLRPPSSFRLSSPLTGVSE